MSDLVFAIVGHAGLFVLVFLLAYLWLDDVQDARFSDLFKGNFR